ncbi:hypothetical protein [Natrinema thermotolerans]|uniref:hypothetical protein n=1 Tax=Natrinema thermotolerans TaxID=121872 RepID=UPI00067871D0|nr:hypothetical protein [Natrinema thermotolerans]QCC57195.1 hypothetical protein DVR14_00535 [Natrinema thermotolerans]
MTHDPHRRQILRRTGAALAALGSAGLATTTTASAQTETQGVLADGFDPEPDLRAFLGGMIDGISLPKSRERATVLADQIRNEFNANSGHWIAYGNWLIDEYDVQAAGDTTVAVTVQVSRMLGDDETAATTIDVGYDTGRDEFTSLEWRFEAAENPDYEATIMDAAAENGSDELAEFRRKFIDTSGDGDHQLPSDAYLNHHAGRYADAIDLGNDGQTVFELLLGEVRS